MNRLSRYAVALVAVLVTGGVLPSLAHSSGVSTPAPEAARSSPPNVVYILVDDMRADEMRFLPRTQELLAERGMEFSEAIAPHPLCCPARAQILTGQYGQNNGVRHNTGRYGGFRALENPRKTLGVWAQRAGYRTALHGKYLNGYERLGAEKKQPGWNRWDPLTYGTYDYVDFGFFDGDTYRDDYVTTRLTQRVAESITRLSARNDPFLVLVSHPAPHTRILVPSHRGENRFPVGDPKARVQVDPGRPGSLRDPAYDEADLSDKPADLRREARKRINTRYVKRMHAGRVAALAAVDRSVVRTVRALRRSGVLDDTVVVFASDNGFLLGEHRLTKKNVLYDEALSIPLTVPGARRRARLFGQDRDARRRHHHPGQDDGSGADGSTRRGGHLPVALGAGARRPGHHAGADRRGHRPRGEVPRLGLPRGEDGPVRLRQERQLPEERAAVRPAP